MTSAPAVNTLELKGKIVKSGMTQAKLARAVGLNPSTFNRKLMGHVPITDREIINLSLVLHLNPAEVINIFLPEIFRKWNES